MKSSTSIGGGDNGGGQAGPGRRLDRSSLIALAALAALVLLIGSVVVDNVFSENKVEDARLAKPCSYAAVEGGVAVSVVLEVDSDQESEGIVRVKVVDGAGEIVVTGSRQFETAGSGKEWHGFDFVIPLRRAQWNGAMSCQIAYASL